MFKDGENFGIITMIPEFCGEETPIQLQDSYFNSELKEDYNPKIKRGKSCRFYMNKFYISKERLDEYKIKKFLFKYCNYIIAYAEVKAAVKKSEDETDLLNKFEKNYDRYYLLEKESIKTFPIFSVEENDFLLVGNDKTKIAKGESFGGRSGSIYKVTDSEYLNELLNAEYGDVSQKTKDLLSKYKSSCVLKETGFYNYEDNHTNFLANFLKKDNTYQLGKVPFENFLKLLKNKTKRKKEQEWIDEILKNKNYYYTVTSQKGFRVGNKNIRPDCTIMISSNDDEKETYQIVLEAKMNADQNIYDDKKYQLLHYKDILESPDNGNSKGTNYIYVSLTIDTNDENIMKEAIKINYQDLIDNVYKYDEKTKGAHIIEDYLRSFHFMTDKSIFPKAKEIYLIPDTHLIKEEDIIAEVERYARINKFNIGKSKKRVVPYFDSAEDSLLFKYFVAIVHNNTSSKADKKALKELYEKIAGYSEEKV